MGVAQLETEDEFDSFFATECRLEWFISLTIQLADNFEVDLQPHPPFCVAPMNWELLNSSYIGPPTCYLPNSFLREEIKAAVRKRSHIKGNAKKPFVRWKDSDIAFEVSFFHFSPTSVIVCLATTAIRDRLSHRDLLSLSFLPAQPDSPLRYAIEKIAAYLKSGNRFSRLTDKLDYEYFPILHIIDFAPRSADKNIDEDVPWHHLASIGTRHRDINKGNTQLVPAYRSKNYSIRNDVCVIDKQSILIVSPSDFLEFNAVKYCACIALSLRNRLKQFHNAALTDTSVATFLEVVRLSLQSPSVISSSVTLQILWPKTLTELQVMQWVANVEHTLSVRSGNQLGVRAAIERLTRLQAQCGPMSTSVERFVELLDVEIKSAWNYSRRMLEELVSLILEKHVGSKQSGAFVALSNQIEQLRDKQIVPDDIRALMDLVRDYGNIGSHSGSNTYTPSEAALVFVLNALVSVFEWYVDDFLPRLQIECASCHAKQPKGQKHCTMCGEKLTAASDVQKCSRCKAVVDALMHFCPQCGLRVSIPTTA